jgi:Ras-related GTP-binding protein C/D
MTLIWSCEQDLYQQPISKLVEFIIAAYNDNPDINLEVFVHKAEKMQEEDKIGAHYHNP